MVPFLCMLWPFLVGGLIGWLLCGWFAWRLKYAGPPRERIIEIEVPVQKVVNNPAHVTKIAELESEIAELQGFRRRVAELDGGEPRVVERFVERAGAKSRSPRIVGKPAEAPVDNPQHLARIGELEAEIEALRRGPQLDLEAARKAGLKVRGADDFTVIEGIGPKIADLIRGAGIRTFAELARTPEADIQRLLDQAGSRFALAKPTTWAAQADLAAANRWEALKAWQDVLDGGEEQP